MQLCSCRGSMGLKKRAVHKQGGMPSQSQKRGSHLKLASRSSHSTFHFLERHLTFHLGCSRAAWGLGPVAWYSTLCHGTEARCHGHSRCSQPAWQSHHLNDVKMLWRPCLAEQLHILEVYGCQVTPSFFEKSRGEAQLVHQAHICYI